MTPFEMEVLLHHYCRHDKFPREDAPIYWPTVLMFVKDGMVTFTTEAKRVYVTEKGTAWIMHALSTPYPERVTITSWQFPERNQK